ncbi:Leucine-rich repeat-containing protein 34 [Camelus dromedarius]|uniref:Leucine-rich repeat-containing protein 34 n=1 Tax=Camelus dromedarius TaxID=9838 RepID=A0A5N4EL33_CAMDR|nr:Leucine-rich repeat-containing protein 34 [Camelus dromedarius]
MRGRREAILESQSPLLTPTTTPTSAGAVADGGGLDRGKITFRKRKWKPSRLEGITLNVAGNSRLMAIERVTGEDFGILCRLLKNNPYINGLDVRYNLLSDIGACYAAKLLQKQHNLTYLNLMFNDIGPEGGEVIAKALHKDTTLKHLRMTGNKIENKGGMYFAAMLQINSSLEKLDLGDCDLEESTVHLGHMLKENQWLVELHMCKHDIKNGGMKQLCDALYLNRSLRYLDVSWLSVVSNNIEGEGLVALSQSMKTNPTLSNIYIWGNKFDEATCVAYSDLIHMGRLKPDNTDVEPFVVDGRVYLAEVSNGLKRHYYWIPGYGAACSQSSNAGFTLVPVGQHL